MSELTMDEIPEAGDKEAQEEEEKSDNGTVDIALGVGFGVLSAGAVAVFGAMACPLCVVACPAYIARGAWKRRQAKQAKDCPYVDCPEEELEADGTDGQA